MNYHKILPSALIFFYVGVAQGMSIQCLKILDGKLVPMVGDHYVETVDFHQGTSLIHSKLDYNFKQLVGGDHSKSSVIISRRYDNEYKTSGAFIAIVPDSKTSLHHFDIVKDKDVFVSFKEVSASSQDDFTLEGLNGFNVRCRANGRFTPSELAGYKAHSFASLTSEKSNDTSVVNSDRNTDESKVETDSSNNLKLLYSGSIAE